jgi:hypothetical protein
MKGIVGRTVSGVVAVSGYFVEGLLFIEVVRSTSC